MFEGIVVGVNVTTRLLPLAPVVVVPFSLITVVLVTWGFGALGATAPLGATCFFGRPAFLAGAALGAAALLAGFFLGLEIAFLGPAVAGCFFCTAFFGAGFFADMFTPLRCI